MRVLYNSNAGSAEGDAIDTLRAIASIDLVECESPEDTIAAAADAGHSGTEVVVAAGGDGTVHLVANGLMMAGSDARTRPVLGVLPLGTGNDFARTLGVPLDTDPVSAIDALRRADRRVIDVMRVTHEGDEDDTGVAINVCAGGFSGAVDEALTSEMKETWGPLAYLVGAVKTLPDLDDYNTHVAWDGGPEEPLAAFNVVVANGRTAGGGTLVAPRADPSDGLLDVVVVEAGADIVRLATAIAAGSDYLDLEGVTHNCVQSVCIRSTPGMWFNVDGELRTNVPVTFEAIPNALRVCVGSEPPPGQTGWK